MAGRATPPRCCQTGIFKAFSQGQYGLGTAVNSVLFVILIVAGYGVIRLLERQPAGD